MASQAGIPPTAFNKGPPYPPTVWAIGGTPVKRVDIPTQAVFMVLFFIGALAHMKIFRGNMARSTHRSFGWHPAFRIASKILFVIIASTLIVLITTTVQSSYTLNTRIRTLDRALQHYGSTILAIVATLPLPMMALTLLIPYSPLDEFGIGRLRTKVIALLISTILLSIGAWYRCGIVWKTPVPRTQALPSYLGKGPFYVLNFLFEFQTVMTYAILRVDRRFHIPNGAQGPGSYSRPAQPSDLEMRDSHPSSAGDSKSKASTILDGNVGDEHMAKNDAERAWPQSMIPRPTGQAQLISSRPQSQRHSLLQHALTQTPTTAQKRQWRASEESRVIRRLGGPWTQLPSPIKSTFSISVGTGLNVIVAPSIRNTLHEDWSPEIDWELASPRRFLSFKKKSMLISE
ncbi:hypothetical protein GQ44DRAFT_747572 [Phaeosphaeriaceae sp. PMI808]|nr:hypothetical protein GQ44DRAFT_747572 [Phaeosphaeriaceae sp. PMI808]